MISLPIGISDFEKIIEDKYDFIDKSLFIKEVFEEKSQVLLLPRPLRGAISNSLPHAKR